MTARDFCYWLQGYFELNRTRPEVTLDAEQAGLIRRHLAMVFAHDIDPQAGPPAHQATLDALHHGSNPLDLRPRC